MPTRLVMLRRSSQTISAEQEDRAIEDVLNMPRPVIEGEKTRKQTPMLVTAVKDTLNSAKPFRFLGLPGELRIRVYTLAVKPRDGRRHNLRDFKQPAITAVSKQVREESLPVMFSDCSFMLVVGSNAIMFPHPRNHSFLNRSIYADKSERSRAGTLGIKRGIMKGLREVGEAAIIRDITFHICPVGDHEDFRDQPTRRLYDDHPSLWVVTHPKVESTIKWNSHDLDSRVEEVKRRTMWKAEDMVKEIGETAGFKGLRLADINRIAKCFGA